MSGSDSTFGAGTSMPLTRLRLASEADRIEQAAAAVDAIVHLVDKAIRAIGDGDRRRAETLLDRAADLVPSGDLPDRARDVIAQARASIARIRAAIGDLTESRPPEPGHAEPGHAEPRQPRPEEATAEHPV